MLRGRAFDASDGETSRLVGLVNDTMARKLWPGKDPIGQRFQVQVRDGKDEKARWVEVVGVVANGKYVMLAEEPRPFFYLPLIQHYSSPITLIVRSAADPLGLVRPLTRVVTDLDPDLPVFNVKSMSAHVRDSPSGLMPLRIGAAVAGGQGVIGIFLGLVGSLGLGVLLSKVLYGLSAMDPRVYVGVTALLLGVSAAACYLPARRAASVDPMVTLRAE